MDSPYIQPSADDTYRGAAKTPVATTPRTDGVLSRLDLVSRRGSTSSTCSTSRKRPRPGHVIRDGQIATLNPIEVRDTPETGKGLFTTQAVPRHALLFAEEPLLFAPKGGDRIGNHQVRKFLEALDPLPPRRRADYYALHCAEAQLRAVGAVPDHQDRMRSWYAQVRQLAPGRALDEAVAAGLHGLAIFRTNNVAASDPDGGDGDDPDAVAGGVVYSVFSRINHACAPNAAFFFLGVRSQRLGVRALRDIAAGEQIFVSYIGESAARELPRRERQERLASWDFECRCTACVAEAEAEEAAQKKKEAGK